MRLGGGWVAKQLLKELVVDDPGHWHFSGRVKYPGDSLKRSSICVSPNSDYIYVDDPQALCE